MPVTLHPHQRKAVDELANGKVLVGGVGVGKTVTSLAYVWEKEMGGVLNDWDSIKKPVDIYVLTTARKRETLDWQKWGAEFGVGDDTDWSLHGIKMTVDSYNNIEKYKEVKDAFFIFDEQRLVGSGAWAKAFLKIAKSNRWILLSATPGDVWLDYIPLFVANGFYKNRTEFKREHIVYNTFSKYPKVDHYVGVGKLLKLRNKILVKMPYERHTTRHIHEVPVDHDVDLFEKVVKKRWHVYEERPLRDVGELYHVMRKVVNSDSSRLDQVRQLMKSHPRIIVFYNFDYELEMLRTLISSSTNHTQTSFIESEKKSKNDDASRPEVFLSQTKSGCMTSSQNVLPGTTRSKEGSKCPDHLTGQPQVDDPTILCQMSTPENTTGKSLKTTGSSLSSSTPETSSTLRPSQSKTPVSLSEWNGHKHEEVPDTERWVYLVQYVAGAEAWDCIATDAVCFYSLTYSYRNFAQAQGRIDRLNTPFKDLHYYVLKSDSFIDKAIWKALSHKQDFNERSVALYT